MMDLSKPDTLCVYCGTDLGEVDRLKVCVAVLEKVAEYAEHSPNCGYTFDPVTQTGEMIGCTCGLEELRADLDALKEEKP